MLEKFKKTIGVSQRIKVFDIKSIKHFNFERGLKSKNIKEYCFTNFSKNQTDEAYDIVIKYYLQYLNNNHDFLDDFVIDELSYNARVERLFKIINKIQGVKYNKRDCQKIIKMKNVYNKELHLYILKNKDNYSILLIDLYHLAIFGRNFESGREHITSIDKKYRYHSNNEYSLDELLLLNDNEKELATN